MSGRYCKRDLRAVRALFLAHWLEGLKASFDRALLSGGAL